ncbi:ImmA/IrrE family metallo-endopeptidase [Pedobacter gandavensis]|uniref:ImmA/IrrE family metallo-endopeptidase n=1 Tax=Pedobacter gandavensis TaxID=2679963 RepID=UPI00293180F3|nr:ImmA/IrrE family metallo-endopeptidase [Pedobacter gandavensis]
MSRAISNQRLRQISDITYNMVLSSLPISRKVNVENIAKLNGVQVQPTDLGEDVSGILVVQEDNAVIAYNPSQLSQRTRFTIAHELGHYILHLDNSKDTVFIDKDFIVKYRSNKVYSEVELRQEQEANAFAASLLMPKEFIFEELDQLNAENLTETQLIERLAEAFDVSIPAMTFRLTNLNILY